MQNLVYPKIPNAGLGNALLVWAKAVVFGNINSFPLIAPYWKRIRIGPMLRGEIDKRYYGFFFKNDIYLSPAKAFLFNPIAKKVYEPQVCKIDVSDRSHSCIYIFNEIPHWGDYFVDIKSHHSLVKNTLISAIFPSVLETIYNCPAPEIGIHVRLGDFRKLRLGEDFAKVGLVRTPIGWYRSVLNTVREIAGYNIPATIFSDGYDCELQDLLALPEVQRSPCASAITDMLTLSKSKLLITSAGSTFSGWASYLGRCPTIWHPAHFHAGVFSDDVAKSIFEGGFDPEIMEVPELLESNIKSIFQV